MVFLTKSFHKQFITVALLASQMKVAVSSLDTIAQSPQNMKQCHTVSPTTESHNVKTVVGQKLMLRDEIGNLIQHRAPSP